MQTTTMSEMWLSGACCLVGRCGGGGSGQEKFCHALDPRLSLHACIADQC